MLMHREPKVVAVIETFLNDEILSTEIVTDSYNIFRQDRNRHGGGVLLLVHKSITFRQREELESDCELIWVQLSLQKKNVLVGVYYRPPGSPVHLLDELDECLARIPQIVPTILCGDFNAASIDWEMCTPLSDGPAQSRFCDIVQDNSLHQLVQHGTRGNNIVDLVLTNDLTIVGNIDVVDGLDGSNHNAVQFGVKLCIPRTKQPKRCV